MPLSNLPAPLRRHTRSNTASGELLTAIGNSIERHFDSKYGISTSSVRQLRSDDEYTRDPQSRSRDGKFGRWQFLSNLEKWGLAVVTPDDADDWYRYGKNMNDYEEGSTDEDPFSESTDGNKSDEDSGTQKLSEIPAASHTRIQADELDDGEVNVGLPVFAEGSNVKIRRKGITYTAASVKQDRRRRAAAEWEWDTGEDSDDQEDARPSTPCSSPEDHPEGSFAARYEKLREAARLSLMQGGEFDNGQQITNEHLRSSMFSPPRLVPPWGYEYLDVAGDPDRPLDDSVSIDSDKDDTNENMRDVSPSPPIDYPPEGFSPVPLLPRGLLPPPGLPVPPGMVPFYPPQSPQTETDARQPGDSASGADDRAVRASSPGLSRSSAYPQLMDSTPTDRCKCRGSQERIGDGNSKDVETSTHWEFDADLQWDCDCCSDYEWMDAPEEASKD